jgi:hypothetical protein
MTRPIHLLVFVLVGWYLLLAGAHYINQRPLWMDEQLVLDNIIQLKPVDLFTRPLLGDQGFPRLYLYVIRQFSDVFHHQLWALRFFPCAAMIAAFFVWLGIGRRVLGDGVDWALFAACWCGSMPMVYYAAELKPYSMDVLACGLIALFTEKVGTASTFSRNGGCPYFLPLLGLFSYPALFLLLLPLHNLVRTSFSQRRWLPELTSYLAVTIAVLGFVYMFDFRVSARHLMEDFWHDYFISLHSGQDFFNTLGKGLNNLVGRRFAENPHWVKVPSRVFIGMGLVYMLAMFRRSPIVCMTLVLFVLQLILAAGRIYPLGVPRMSLFFSPLLFIMTILVLKFLRERWKIFSVLPMIFAAYLVFVSLGIAWDVFMNKNLGAESAVFTPADA